MRPNSWSVPGRRPASIGRDARPPTTSCSSGSSTRPAACSWSSTRRLAAGSTGRSGLALRKRFCATFDFELQAAANDDAVILSLGPQHSFPLEVGRPPVAPQHRGNDLRQAVLASPMFASRWRWNLNRSLAVLRFRGGKKNPLPIQRMEADDLMAAVFPALAACQENTPPGPIQFPDHVIVRQVLHDCLHEAMDVDGLEALVAALHSGEVRSHFVDSVEPSVLSHEIVNGKPYTFLDDAPSRKGEHGRCNCAGAYPWRPGPEPPGRSCSGESAGPSGRCSPQCRGAA